MIRNKDDVCKSLAKRHCSGKGLTFLTVGEGRKKISLPLLRYIANTTMCLKQWMVSNFFKYLTFFDLHNNNSRTGSKIVFKQDKFDIGRRQARKSADKIHTFNLLQ